jgi:hypothetical protein
MRLIDYYFLAWIYHVVLQESSEKNSKDNSNSFLILWYNWTVTTIHNHMLNESPKLLFMHWTVTGNPDEIVQQAKEAIMQTSSYANATAPTAANGTRGGTPSSAGP